MDRSTLLQQWYEKLLLRISIFDPFLIVFIFTCLCLLKIFRKTNKLNLPPSPFKLPIIGNLHQIGKAPHEKFKTLSKKYGPLMLLHFGQSPVLIVQSAEIAKEIIKSANDVEFAGRPHLTVAEDIFYGCTDIAFCPYNEYWRQAKKICVLEILTQRRVNWFQFVRQEEVAKMVETIKRLTGKKKQAVDFREMFMRISNNVISRCALGKIYENDDVSFGELSRRVMDLFGAVCFQDLIPFLGCIDVLTGFSGNLKRTSKALHDFLDQVIEEHRDAKKKKNDDENESNDKKDFVDILLQLQKDNTYGINLTEENLKALVLDMFLGGTDTTASTLEWAMAQMVKNPRVMKKVQDEIRGLVGKKSKIEETDIDRMVYLKCIVKESLRIHAPVLITRQSSTNTVKLAGYDIPPKTTILINAWAIQRDPSLWDRPEEFIPERFIDDHSVDFRGNNSQLIPFGGGRRGCPGISFAVAEIEFVLANLIHWFDWELPEGEKELDMSEAYKLTIRKKVPLRLVPILHSH
ncbi:hypothetical protein ACFE04_028083 [Oxalis oulophora]